MRFVTKRKLEDGELRKLAWRLAGAFYREETFWVGQYGEPQQAITAEPEGDSEPPDDVPLAPGEHLYTVNLMGHYYGPNYERGDATRIIAVAEWIEANLPEAVLYYGGDCSDTLARFDVAARQQLKLHFWQHGHLPYSKGFGGFDKGLQPPLCKLCQEPMIECGGGGGDSFVYCYGCTAKAIVRNRDSKVLRYWTDKQDFFKVSEALRQEVVS